MSEALSSTLATSPPASHPGLPDYRLPAMLAFAVVHPLVHGGLYAVGGLVAYLAAQLFGTGVEAVPLAGLGLAGGMILLGFFMASGPPVLLASAIGFYVLRNAPAVTLKHAMIGTLVLAVPCCALYLLLLASLRPELDPTRLAGLAGNVIAGAFVALPGALIATYVTWHFTRRWHAAEAVA